MKELSKHQELTPEIRNDIIISMQRGKYLDSFKGAPENKVHLYFCHLSKYIRNNYGLWDGFKEGDETPYDISDDWVKEIHRFLNSN